MIICRVRVIPNRNPIFHRYEIEEGVGRSERDAFRILRIGWVLVSWFFIIRTMNLGFGRVGVSEQLVWKVSRLELGLLLLGEIVTRISLFFLGWFLGML